MNTLPITLASQQNTSLRHRESKLPTPFVPSLCTHPTLPTPHREKHLALDMTKVFIF